MLKRIARFFKGLFRKPDHAPGTVADGAELELEKERRRGVRGD